MFNVRNIADRSRADRWVNSRFFELPFIGYQSGVTSVYAGAHACTYIWFLQFTSGEYCIFSPVGITGMGKESNGSYTAGGFFHTASPIAHHGHWFHCRRRTTEFPRPD